MALAPATCQASLFSDLAAKGIQCQYKWHSQNKHSNDNTNTSQTENNTCSQTGED